MIRNDLDNLIYNADLENILFLSRSVNNFFSTRDSVRPVARLTFRLKQPTALVMGGEYAYKKLFSMLFTCVWPCGSWLVYLAQTKCRLSSLGSE